MGSSQDCEYKMVVVDCPMRYIDDPFVRDLFGKLAQLKIEGFDTSNSKYFAFGTNDLVATHFIVGEEDRSGAFTPLISYKAISDEDSKHWGIPFDGVDAIRQTNSAEHINALEIYLSNYHTAKVGYSSSLSLSPQVKDKRSKVHLIQMFECMAAKYITDFGVSSSICIARVKKKSHLILQRLGYNFLSMNGEALPPVKFPQYINDEFYIMTLDAPNEEGVELIRKFQKQWDDRIEISERDRNVSHTYSSYRHGEHTRVS